MIIKASINLSKIPKDKIIEGNKGKYLNITCWVEDEPDQFGNNVAIQVSQSKEERDAGERKVYLGNGKTFEKGKKQSISSDDDLPF